MTHQMEPKLARRDLSGLAKDQQAVAMVEFAFMAPILLLLGLVGLELSNVAITHMRVSQLAAQIADNASRLGDRETLSAQRVYEGDMNDLFVGARIQASNLDLFENGRVIVSSLEQNGDGGQWIHWQRCMGKKDVASVYGDAGTGETGTGFAGMGESGNELTAPANGAVMYVEVVIDYSPITDTGFTDGFGIPSEVRSEAAFTVRSARDLTGIFEQDGISSATCDKLEAI